MLEVIGFFLNPRVNKDLEERLMELWIVLRLEGDNFSWSLMVLATLWWPRFWVLLFLGSIEGEWVLALDHQRGLSVFPPIGKVCFQKSACT